MTKAKQAIANAQVAVPGHFVLANGHHGQLKLEMDNLWRHPASLAVIVDLLARADGLPAADVILGVPTGGQRLAQAVMASGRAGGRLAMLERVPGGAKQDFRFASPQDQQLASNAKSVRIYEDVVTSLSSIAGVVKLLQPQRQTIQSLAIWRRGQVSPAYRQGITDHYLVEELIDSWLPQDCPACANS